MAQTAHKGHGNAGADTLRAAAGEKQRQELFKASEREKQRIMAETSAYRLQEGGAKWASGGGAAEARLAQSTVGLVTKEEFARRRKEAEKAEEAARHPQVESKEEDKEADKEKVKEKSSKKSKGKQRAATLSFAMEEDGEAEEVVFKKPKKNPTVDYAHEVASDAAKAAAEAAGLVKPPPKKESPEEITKLPAGYTCVRETGHKQYEASLEVMASVSAPRNRVTGISSHTVTLLVRGAERAGEANAVLVSFLRSILGGNAITCDILRGHKAPVKTVRINGVESLDCLYHRLLMAHKFLK